MKEEINEDFPIDIESVLSIGVKNWYESFEWPISWGNFIEIENKVKSILDNQIKTNPEFADIIVVNYKLYIEFTNYFTALLLKVTVGEKAKYSDNNTYYKSVFEEGIPLPFVKFPKIDSHKKTIKSRLRKLKKYLEDNKFSVPKVWKPSVYIFNESRSNLTLEHLRNKYIGRFYPLSFFDYYKANDVKQIDDITSNKINILVKIISEDLYKCIELMGVVLTVHQKEFVFNHIFDLYTKTYKTLQVVKKNIGNKKIKLFIGSNNNYFSRIISVAIRNNGGEIHGFKHGEPINYEYDLVSWLDLSLSDYFYEPTDRNSEMLKNIAKKFPPLNANECTIKSMKNNRYDTILNNLKIQTKDYISTVMIIGNCFRHTSFSSATAVFPTMQLYIELYIINKLKSQGYKVIYKMHPENLDTRIGFVKDFSVFKALFPDDVEINSDSFESSEQEVDAYAFYYTATSTFLTAMASKKSILLFDIKLREYPKEMLDILTSRCDYKLTKLNFI